LSDPSGERVPVGRVGRPHGLEGAFVVEGPSTAPDRFAVGATLLAGGGRARVVESKRAGGRVVIRLDRPVERGTQLEVLRSDLPPAAEGWHYAFELIGLRVEEENGRALGSVVEVSPGVANDVLELDSGLSLPFVEACVLEIDLPGRRILVAPGFGEHG
jgi:16S rRNA processing protein RimM